MKNQDVQRGAEYLVGPDPTYRFAGQAHRSSLQPGTRVRVESGPDADGDFKVMTRDTARRVGHLRPSDLLPIPAPTPAAEPGDLVEAKRGAVSFYGAPIATGKRGKVRNTWSVRRGYVVVDFEGEASNGRVMHVSTLEVVEPEPAPEPPKPTLTEEAVLAVLDRLKVDAEKKALFLTLARAHDAGLSA